MWTQTPPHSNPLRSFHSWRNPFLQSAVHWNNLEPFSYGESENPYQQFLHPFLQETALTKIILQNTNSLKVARQPLVCDNLAALQYSLKWMIQPTRRNIKLRGLCEILCWVVFTNTWGFKKLNCSSSITVQFKSVLLKFGFISRSNIYLVLKSTFCSSVLQRSKSVLYVVNFCLWLEYTRASE